MLGDDEIKTRLRALISVGKERGFLTRSEIIECFKEIDVPMPPVAKYSYPKQHQISFDDEMLGLIAETFHDMGIDVR